MISKFVDRNITVLSKTESVVVLFEYGEIVYSSEISNGIYEIDYVWNQSDNETDPKRNAQNLIEVCSLMMIEGWWYQESHQINENTTFHTTNENLMWV